ncbi:MULTISPECIES: hypothetical protein [Kitasatospora]|uniref:Uncharacterized protein n=2 Tax=Kitasatospora TaxID=2063 RepID=A0ABT1IYM4_9ACTN|nr:hypothetical protein [Kitasatospora paracochleata]MCP2310233.1 hypothetical protein [Kitasatospora paracochleata]
MPDPHTQASDQSGTPAPAAPGPGSQGRRLRPAQLIFEPPAGEPEPERFFDLDTITDPGELLRRATELTLAFRAAAERATDFQALAAAQLADPKRFDSLTPAEIGARADWTPDYAARMVEYGRGLQKQRHAEGLH